MNNRLLALVPLAGLAALAACSSQVGVVAGATSGGGTGGGATSTSSASGSGTGGKGSSSGTGGTGGSTFISASSASSASSSSGAPANCPNLFLDVKGDGPPQHYTGLCAPFVVEGNPMGPVAYTPMGGGIISSLTIEGCATTGMLSPGLSLSVSNLSVPGTDTKATATYTDAANLVWGSMGAGTVAVTIDVYQDIIGMVEGSYTAAVQSQAATKMLSGTFRVCHVQQVPIP